MLYLYIWMRYVSINNFNFNLLTSSQQKEEFWWVVIGDKKTNKLFTLKRISFAQQAKAELRFLAPDAGTHELTIYLICDSYIGCDQVGKVYLIVD